MNHPPRIGCLIMAAGNASRFGSNKLAAKVDGKMLIEHALETVPREEFARVTVVTQYDEVLVLARRFGFTVLVNPFPEWGASHTVRLGTEAMADCGAILYQVADQPLLRRESVRAEVEFFRRHPDRIVAMGHGGVRGNPCIFPARFFPELTALEGDRGGSAVIRRHEDALALFEISPMSCATWTRRWRSPRCATRSRELRRRHFAAEVLLHQRLDALLLIAAGKR
ncbi:MAG: nucleotidyltransferase family protein [Oscillospiraceae bacterium]